MKRFPSVLAGAVLFATVAYPRAGETYASKFEEGGILEAKQDWKGAAGAFEQARIIAEGKKSTADAVQAALRHGSVVRRWAAAEPELADKLSADAERAYGFVLRSGTPAQKELARNNLGVFYLSVNQPAKAKEVFAALPDPANLDAHVYHFNYGLALEKTSDLSSADEQYKLSLSRRPNYEPAAERRCELLRKRPPSPEAVSEALTLFDGLLAPKAHQVRVVGGQLPRFLADWKEKAVPLLPVLLRYYRAAGVGAEEFAKDERPRLEALARMTPTFNSDIDALKKAFDIEALDARARPLFARRYEVTTFFPAASRFVQQNSDASAEFSRLLKWLGETQEYMARSTGDDPKAAQAAARRALLFDTAAFFVDVRNTEAVAAAADMLDRHHEQIDPKNVYSRELIEGIFDVKSELYHTAKTRREWATICACHIILGDMYGKQGIWGEENNLHGAIGQWQRVLEVEQLIRTGRSQVFGVTLPLSEVDPRFPQSPVARLNLALAYWAMRNKDKGAAFYVQAIECFIDARNFGRAALEVEKAKVWLAKNPPEDSSWRQRIVDLGSVVPATQSVLKESPRPLALVRTPLLALAFDPEEKHLIAASGGEMLFANVGDTKFEVRKTFLSGSKARMVAFTPGAALLAAGDGVNVFVGSPGAEKSTLELSHRMPVMALAFSGDGKVLASSSGDRTIHTWDSVRGESLRTFEVPRQPATSLTLSFEGVILAGLVGGEARLWSLKDGPAPFTLKPEAPITSLSLRPDGKQIVTGGRDGALRLWDVETGKDQQAALPLQPEPVTYVQFAPDGRTFLAAGLSGPVCLFDTKSGKQLVRLPCQGRIRSMAFSPNGRLLAVGTEQGPVGSTTGRGEVQVWAIDAVVRPR